MAKAIDSLLTGEKTKVIAFFTQSHNPEITTYLLSYANQYAQEHRNCAIRFLPDSSPDFLVSLSECDGIFACIHHPGTYTKLRETTKRPIVCTTELDDPRASYVDADAKAEGAMAAEWFLSHRFVNFAFCSIGGDLSCFDVMGKAFSSTLKKAGFGCIMCDFEKLNVSAIESGRVTLPSYLDEWIPTLPPKTALLCKSDMTAALAIQACLRAKRAVPDDIAVMGVCNSVMICSSAGKAISSVAEDNRLLTYTALQMLEDMIDHPEKANGRQSVLIPPLGIVERESTRVYPVDPPWLAKALLLIDSNVSKPIALSDLADVAGVSQPTLQGAIRKTFGMSANKYILSVKMREAKRLMDLGGYNVKELAARIGFSTQSYFTRAYTAYYGHPPSADRKIP